jgi:hypothetical protein
VFPKIGSNVTDMDKYMSKTTQHLSPTNICDFSNFLGKLWALIVAFIYVMGGFLRSERSHGIGLIANELYGLFVFGFKEWLPSSWTCYV